MRAVEPAVGPPGERVQHLVRVLVAPAVEHHLRRAARPVRRLVERDEEQVRRGADPHAAEPDLDAADEVQVLDEHLPPVEAAVAVGVLEDQNAVLAGALRRADGIGVRFGDPQPAAIVEGEGDRPHDVRLGRRQRDREPLRHGHRAGRLSGDSPACGHRIHRRHRADVGRRDFVREEGPRRVEAEVVEVDVRPRVLFEVDRRGRARLVVHEADEDGLVGVGRADRRPPAAARPGRHRRCV